MHADALPLHPSGVSCVDVVRHMTYPYGAVVVAMWGSRDRVAIRKAVDMALSCAPELPAPVSPEAITALRRLSDKLDDFGTDEDQPLRDFLRAYQVRSGMLLGEAVAAAITNPPIVRRTS